MSRISVNGFTSRKTLTARFSFQWCPRSRKRFTRLREAPGSARGQELLLRQRELEAEKIEPLVAFR